MNGEPEFIPSGAPARTNRNNDGRNFQSELAATFAAYQSQKIATIEKTDPPVAVLWQFDKQEGKKKQRVIFKVNPFVDYVGVWSARNGRALFIEAKSTSKHRLALNRDGGITEEQIASLFRWRRAGAAVCVVWRFEIKACLFTPEMLQAAIGAGAKSLLFSDGLPVANVGGLWDFLPVLEAAIWPAKES